MLSGKGMHRRKTVRNNNRSNQQKQLCTCSTIFCTFLCRCFARLQHETSRNFLVTRFKADIHEGFCSRSTLQSHFARVSTHEGALFAPGACSQIFNQLNIVEDFAGWKFCSRGSSIPMKSLVHTQELCSRSMLREQNPSCVSTFMEEMSYVFPFTFFHSRSFSPCNGGRQHFSFCHRYKIFMLFFQQKNVSFGFLSLALNPCHPFSR